MFTVHSRGMTMPVDQYILTGNDRCDQSFFVFLARSAGIEGVDSGICRMFSINWLLWCIYPFSPPPNEAWYEMKLMGPKEFLQIARQQILYKQRHPGEEEYSVSVARCLKLVCGDFFRVGSSPTQIARNGAGLEALMSMAADSSNTTPQSCIISFQCPEGNHCIAAVRRKTSVPIASPGLEGMTEIKEMGVTGFPRL